MKRALATIAICLGLMTSAKEITVTFTVSADGYDNKEVISEIEIDSNIIAQLGAVDGATKDPYIRTTTKPAQIFLFGNNYITFFSNENNCYFKKITFTLQDFNATNNNCSLTAENGETRWEQFNNSITYLYWNGADQQKTVTFNALTTTGPDTTVAKFSAIEVVYELIEDNSGNSSGVESVTIENESSTYYNLQGQRVAHPIPGNIYVRQTSSKSSVVRY